MQFDKIESTDSYWRESPYKCKHCVKNHSQILLFRPSLNLSISEGTRKTKELNLSMVNISDNCSSNCDHFFTINNFYLQ